MREIKRGLAEAVAQHAHGNAEVKKRREKRVCAVAGEIWIQGSRFLASRSKGSTDAATGQHRFGRAPTMDTQLNSTASAPAVPGSSGARRFQRALSAAAALLRVAAVGLESWLRLRRCINLYNTATGQPPGTSSTAAAVHVSGLVQRCCTSCLIRPWRRSDCSKPPALWPKDQWITSTIPLMMPFGWLVSKIEVAGEGYCKGLAASLAASSGLVARELCLCPARRLI